MRTGYPKKFFTLSGLLSMGLIIYSPMVVGMFFVFGENRFINIQSIGLTLILVWILWFFLRIGRKTKNPLIIYWVLITVVYYLSRIPYWLVDPFSLGQLKYIAGSSVDVNRALVYVCVGSFVLGLTLIFSHKRRKKINVPETINDPNSQDKINALQGFSLKILVCMGLVIFVIELVMFLRFGSGRRGETVSPIPGWLMRFVDYRIIFYLLLASIGNRWRKLPRSDKIFVLGFCAIFVGFTIIKGTRSGIIELVSLWIIFQLILYKRVVIFKRTFLALVLLAVFSVGTYIFATESRYKIMLTKGYSKRAISLSEVIEEMKGEGRYSGKLGRQIFERLSMLDRLTALMSPHGASMRKYLNVGNVLKSTSNRLLPGEFFPGLIPLLNRYYNVAICGWSPEYAKTHYSTNTLTNFGEYYILFGWVGGLLTIFIVGYILGRLYVKVDQSKSPYRLLLLLFVFHSLFASWLLSFGTDCIIYILWGRILTVVLYIALAKFIGVVLVPFYRTHTVRSIKG